MKWYTCIASFLFLLVFLAVKVVFLIDFSILNKYTESTEIFMHYDKKNFYPLIFNQKHSIIHKWCTPVWWNWQTCRTQNPVVAIPCGFDPRHRHHIGATILHPNTKVLVLQGLFMFLGVKNTTLSPLHLSLYLLTLNLWLYRCVLKNRIFVI